MLLVVSAIIVRKGMPSVSFQQPVPRVLLTQRRLGKDYPLCWESPGGKVDVGETHHQALFRELGEELGVKSSFIAISPLPCFEQRFDTSQPGITRDAHLFMYRVKLEAGAQPRAVEGQGIGWFTASEMSGLDLTPGNEAAIGAVIACMGAD